jgi:hypothetical protein
MQSAVNLEETKNSNSSLPHLLSSLNQWLSGSVGLNTLIPNFTPGLSFHLSTPDQKQYALKNGKIMM